MNIFYCWKIYKGKIVLNKLKVPNSFNFLQISLGFILNFTRIASPAFLWVGLWANLMVCAKSLYPSQFSVRTRYVHTHTHTHIYIWRKTPFFTQLNKRKHPFIKNIFWNLKCFMLKRRTDIKNEELASLFKYNRTGTQSFIITIFYWLDQNFGYFYWIFIS